PVEVVSLALVPVRGRPDAGHGGHARLLLGHAHLEREARHVLQRQQAVDALEARHPRQVVHAAHPRQHREGGLGIVAQERAHLDQVLGRQVERVVTHGLSGLALERHAGESLAQPPLDVLGSQHYAAPLRLLRGNGPRSTREERIFSWSFMIPWSRASGRGGQPGTYTSTGTILSTPWRIA